jgi:hypothetical protein
MSVSKRVVVVRSHVMRGSSGTQPLFKVVVRDKPYSPSFERQPGALSPIRSNLSQNYSQT